MRCFGISCYFQSTKEVKASDLHRFSSSVDVTQIELHKPHGCVGAGRRLFTLDQLTMQVNDLLEPNVRIRELKKDRVNFVLENVDIS
jgi:hypothetical protein